MLPVWRGLTAAIVAAAALLAGATPARAQTTTTTAAATTSTTTTTVPPHPFTPATASCVDDADRALKACKRSGGTTCRTDYETAYSKCFAAPAGVSCAKRCITRETSCFAAVPKTKKTCRQSCRTARKRDVLACKRIADGDNLWRGGDGSCLTTAAATLDLCKFVCSQASKDCRTALKFCVANCANL
jgi:hypothetical protein